MLVFLREVSFETMRLIGTVNVCVNIYIYMSVDAVVNMMFYSEKLAGKR